MPARVYICDFSHNSELSKLLAYDPYLDKTLNEQQLSELKKDLSANVIFARQDYVLKDGISLGLDRTKNYLYLSASEEFLEKADKKLKEKITGIIRADKETEEKIIKTVEGERESSEEGLGSIFG